MKKVAVVILNYKLKDLTLKCLISVISSSYSNLEIIVVDNNSEDGIEQELPKQQNLFFIQNGKNTGFSGGNNVGIKRALSDSADYVLILNPDTLVEKDTIAQFVTKAEELNAAIAGPKIYFDNS